MSKWSTKGGRKKMIAHARKIARQKPVKVKMSRAFRKYWAERTRDDK